MTDYLKLYFKDDITIRCPKCKRTFYIKKTFNPQNINYWWPGIIERLNYLKLNYINICRECQ